MMYDNGSVSENVKYKDICKEQFHVHVAYNYKFFWFEIVNNSMVDSMVKYQMLHGSFVGSTYASMISQNSEILSIFFKNLNIIVKWINCNQTWGWYDDETGKWTGAVGQVSMVDHTS